MKGYVFLIAAALGASNVNSVSAAPDGTLGMALVSAVVDHTGGLVRGSGVVAASRTSQGQYTVTFNRDVSTCTYAATSTSQGVMVGSDRGPSTNIVRVYPMYPSSGGGGTISDSGFNLLVFCAQ